MGRSLAIAVLCAGAASDADADAGGTRTAITVWAPPPAPALALYGGVSYGGHVAPSGAMITERRDLELPSAGEVRVVGVAATVDPATVQLRSLTDPGGVTISEQRFVPGASTPDQILARHLGDPVTVVTAKGEITGVLRSIDARALVVEVGSGDQRRLQVMRRDGYVQDIRVPAGKHVDRPSLVWRLAANKPGKHEIEVTYRADGLTWSADYLAVFDETRKTIDFSAWATLRNTTGASFDGAEVTLVSGALASPVLPYSYGYLVPVRPPAPPARFVVPAAVHVRDGESVQVELLPPRIAAKARPIVALETIQDLSPQFQAYPATDCTMLTQSVPATVHADIMIEVDLPAAMQLPEGRVRVFRRADRGVDRLDAIGEQQLPTIAGIARIPLARHTEVSGERKSVCNVDERARTITERVEIRIENKAKQAADVVVRDFLWRFPVWRIDPADENTRGKRVAPQVQEYRVNVPAGGRKTVTYSVVYQYQQ